MPHGLCMLDAEQRLVLANSRLPTLLRLDPSLFQPGVPTRTLLRECVRSGTLSRKGLAKLLRDVETRLLGSGRAPVSVETEHGRALSLTFSSMNDGGSVILVDDVTEQKRAEAQIKYLAHYDALTGLPNRTSFREEVDHVLKVISRIGACAVLFIDLDQFKQVNDTLGHSCGDELLKKVADRLRHIVRETDVIARLGGDEFVVLQSPLDHPDQASLLAQRIVEGLSMPYDLDGLEAVIGACVGIARAPVDGQHADLLLKNADMALYRAKSEGRACWRFFEPGMDAKAKARRKLELDLRNAVAADAFELYYQPLMNLRTNRISTCEALLRWPHAERGMISPVEFIPVAEEMGLIVEIGTSVLRKACLEAMNWPNDVGVAVNLSAIQFRRGDVVKAAQDALKVSGLAPNRLELEITESVLIQDTVATRAVLVRLRALGIKISLDDFGTGYSSLSYLRNFPLDKIKIDRSFLLDIEDNESSRTLLYGVARLSTELGLSVVAEGVETDGQLALIVRDGHIEEAQGFLFSRPVSAKPIRALLYGTSPGAIAKMKVA
jgi:diguanylate cyclase (GGDEF)-like protein